MVGENTRSASRYTTPLAAPPPPLHLLSAQQGRGAHNVHLPAYAGARHTLGPMFNDEEDGDDSAFIAQQMALLGLDQRQAEARNRDHGGQRRRNVTANSNTGNGHNQGANRRDNRRQPRTQSHQPHSAHPHDTEPGMNLGMDSSQQAAAYLALQAQAQQALLAAQIQAGGLDMATQQALAQRYQIQLQLAALQIQQQQQYTRPQHQTPHSRNTSNNRRLSPNPQSQSQSQSQYYHQNQENQTQNYTHTLTQRQAPSQGTYVSGSDERNHLAAQVQANLLARTRRQKNLDDAETRALFEAAPNTIKDHHQNKPFSTGLETLQSPFIPSTKPSEGMWRSEIPTPKNSSQNPGSAFASRFGQVRCPPTTQGMNMETPSTRSMTYRPTRSSTGDTVSTSTEAEVETEPPTRTNTTAQTSPTSPSPLSEVGGKEPSPKYLGVNKTPSLGIGLGRPSSGAGAGANAGAGTVPLNRPTRAWSSPSITATALSTTLAEDTAIASQPRSVSYTYTGSTVIPTRQPFGPPGNASKLNEENFKSVLRKRAGLGLTMLNRRASPTSGAIPLEDA